MLAIMGLSSDFSDKEAAVICDYIEKGGDLIITNDVDYNNKQRDFPNFQKISPKLSGCRNFGGK